MSDKLLNKVVWSIGAGIMYLALAGSAQAAPILIGTATGSNSFPFNSSSTADRYQQVYSASSFSGPVDITAISFFNNNNPGAVFETADYMFTFSTSNFAVNTLDTANLNANPGVDAALFASVNLSGATGSMFTITAGSGGGSSFVYDPLAGDLLVDIFRTSQVIGSGSGFLDAMNNSSGGLFSRAHNFGAGFENYGLVTEFETETVTAGPAPIPEPATLALFGIGLVGLGLARRRRKSRHGPAEIR